MRMQRRVRWRIPSYLWVVLYVFIVCRGPSMSTGRTIREMGPDYPGSSRFRSQREECDAVYTCGKTQSKAYNSNDKCHCDPLCGYYNDCCLSVKADDFDESKWPVFPRKLLQCSYLEISSDSIFMVKKCPLAFQNTDVKEKCELSGENINKDDILLSVPTSEKKTGIAFKNIFCALCNGLSQLDIAFWNVTIECRGGGEQLYLADDGRKKETEKKGPISQQIANMTGCYLKYNLHFPTGITPPRTCEEGVVDSCPAHYDDSAINNLCNNHTAYLYSSSLTYKNLYCAMCNNADLESLRCDSVLWRGSRFEQDATAFVSYRVLLDFNTGSGLVHGAASNAQNKQVNTTCGIGHRYDPFTGQCRFLLCPAGFELKEDNCLPIQNEMALFSLENQTCPLVSLNLSEVIAFENGTIFILSANVSLNMSSYSKSKDGSAYLICSDFYDIDNSGIAWRNVDDEIQSVVSIVGVVLSMIALVVLITIYSCFSSLQNTPGKCLLALSCSLLLGQFLFILSGSLLQNRVVCAISGASMHFSFLSSFFWMNVLAFDIWRTFTRQYQRAPKAKGNRRFLRHAIYAFGVPFMIVAICAGMDLANSEAEFSPRYGSHICWISNKYVLLGAFALPLACVILTNTVFFAMSVYHIHQVTTQTAKVMRPGKTEEGSSWQLLLYVKLSTIMGLTWVFGFVANFTSAAMVFWYLFIIFNSLQGLFIALGFLCNRTVYRMVKRSVCGALGVVVSDSRTSFSKRTTKTHSTSI